MTSVKNTLRRICLFVLFIDTLSTCSVAQSRAVTDSARVGLEIAVWRNKLTDVCFKADSLGMIAVIDQFQRLIDDEQWGYLAQYYIAFGKWQLALTYMTSEPESNDLTTWLHEGAEYAAKSLELNPQFADAHVLAVNCRFPLLTLEPDSMMVLLKQIADHKKAALSLEQDNPRVMLTDAHDTFFTPEQWGGSQKRGLSKYRTAIKRFSEQDSDQSNPLPQWGYAIAYAWLGNAYLMLSPPDSSAALSAYRQSLELRPDFRFVKSRIADITKKHTR